MGHDWIIDVLADMRAFAGQNDMPQLCGQLDDALAVATQEVARLRNRRAIWDAGDMTPLATIGPQGRVPPQPD